MRVRIGRRRALSCLLVASALTIDRRVRAEEVAVPIARQAELLVRVAAYDRNLPARAAGTVRILILTNADDADSRAVAGQMDAALRKFDKIRRPSLRNHHDALPGGRAGRRGLQAESRLRSCT